jgi:hypothetical protein
VIESVQRHLRRARQRNRGEPKLLDPVLTRAASPLMTNDPAGKVTSPRFNSSPPPERQILQPYRSVIMLFEPWCAAVMVDPLPVACPPNELRGLDRFDSQIEDFLSVISFTGVAHQPHRPRGTS